MLKQIWDSERLQRARGLALYTFDARYTVAREKLQLALTILEDMTVRVSSEGEDETFVHDVLHKMLRKRLAELASKLPEVTYPTRLWKA